MPIAFTEMPGIEVIEHGVACGKREACLTPELFIQAGQISREDAKTLREQQPDAFIESQLAVRHGPIGDALIQEHSAQPDQPWVDDFVHGARRLGFRLMRHSTGKTGAKQRMQRRLRRGKTIASGSLLSTASI